jgi:S-disulfanyl-L-cysteine oxidoreductase SoxD
MRRSVLFAALAAGVICAHPAEPAERFGFGRTPTPQELAGWDIDVRADGQGLPPGSGSVKEGQQVYADRCADCHGPSGEGKPMDRLAGGFDTLRSARPVKTVGSFWPYATTLFDYLRRAMPFDAPQSLSQSQVYAVSAYVLYLNHIVPEDAVLDAQTLSRIAMPNRNGFSNPDPRPDAHNKRCVQDCN